MKNNRTLFLIFPAVLAVMTLLPSCGGTPGTPAASGDTLSLRYATGLTIENHDGYTVVTVSDPWNAGQTLHTYALVPRDADVPAGLPPATVVRVPLERAVISTSVHCALVMEMGRGERIAGVCDLQYINLPWIQERSKDGRIADCGNSMSPTIEKIIELEPDAVFLSPFQNSGGYGRVDALGIPVIEMADYMESGPLARAEWMKFYGLLFGAEARADSMFNDVERQYGELKTAAAASSKGRTLMMDKMTGSVWYVPGGGSTIGRLIADANAGYAWSADDRSGSLEMSFETVLDKCEDADVWLVRYYGPSPLTAESLSAENKGYERFKAFRNREIYGCNTAVSMFYEETPFHPERLLRDIVIITHPEMENMGMTSYFRHI